MNAGCITGSRPATRQQRLRLTVDQTAIPGFVLPGVSEAQRTRCEQEVQRVLDSRAFAKASRLAALFEYICRKSLDGALDELTEQQIGIHVFRRSPGYNSAEDTIVRGTARLLRQRIETYYDQEGAHNGFRVSIPKGGYVAVFTPANFLPAAGAGEALFNPLSSTVPVESTVDEPLTSASPVRWPRSARITCLFAIASALVAAALLVIEHHSPTAQMVNTGPEILWRALFQSGHKTLIVPGDAALDAYISFEKRPVTLEQYTEQSYQQQTTAASRPRDDDASVGFRSVTPMSALRLVANLVRVPEWIGMPEAENWLEIRYARDMSAADVNNDNLILIGSDTFNPWVSLYQPQLDFHTQWDFARNIYTVTNRAPQKGEQAAYSFSPETGPLGALTVVALTDNTQGGGRVLLIEGTTMGTTYGGMRFLFDKPMWQPVIAAATDGNGRLHNFEVLLRNDFLRGGVSNTRPIAVHVH
jgi:hypothetical protein